MLCVTLAALASWAPRPSASTDERHAARRPRHHRPGRRAIPSVLLWNRNTVELRRDRRRQLRAVRHADAASIVGILTIMFSSQVVERDGTAEGRVLRARALLHRRHDHDGDGQRPAGHLPRARDPVARGLRADRHPAGRSACDGGGVQVFPARRVLERVLPVRHRVHLRADRQHAPRSDRARIWRRSR